MGQLKNLILIRFYMTMHQVRGFAPTGMLECWNIEKLGSDLGIEEGTEPLD